MCDTDRNWNGKPINSSLEIDRITVATQANHRRCKLPQKNSREICFCVSGSHWLLYFVLVLCFYSTHFYHFCNWLLSERKLIHFVELFKMITFGTWNENGQPIWEKKNLNFANYQQRFSVAFLHNFLDIKVHWRKTWKTIEQRWL